MFNFSTLHNHPLLPPHQTFGGHLLPSAGGPSPIDGGMLAPMSGTGGTAQAMGSIKMPSVEHSLQQPALQSQHPALEQLPQQSSSATQPQRQLTQTSQQQHPHAQSQMSGQFTDQQVLLHSRSTFAAPTSYTSGDQQRQFPPVLSAGLLPLFAPTVQQTSFAAAPLPSLSVQPFIPTTTASNSQELRATVTGVESRNSSNRQVVVSFVRLDF